ncbi:hypothetical protein NIIDNTM18_42360 [Mycolicibacterium litorale]|uniref:DUF2510 domain-containing protein n=1 Tax=Mycolicibacterium litorale TaxID=758802 RepID=A0A6S6PG47_9MYCO|nr:hypothetical protein NIIDNTM18_42360 [Mycolicibacterium litorale]
MSQPGWYPDPHGGPSQRYFDGTAWTEHIAPAPATQAPPVVYGPTVIAPKPVNHAFHLIMTLLTCGAWSIVWIIVAIAAGGRR